MDLWQILERRKTGSVSAEYYKRTVYYALNKKIYSQYVSDFFQSKFCMQASDFSLYKDRLLIAHKNFKISLFDVSKPIYSGYECLRVSPARKTQNPGLECINWNSDGSFFTATIDDKFLYCMDAEHMTEIEILEIKGISRILQHKPSPHNSAIVAVASRSSKVTLVDLKSGNSTSTSALQPEGVLSVSWCGLTEHLLVTAGNNGTCFWDTRSFKKPLLINDDNCEISAVLPSFEIIPNTDRLIMLNIDRDITIWDAHRLQKEAHFGPFMMPFARDIRYRITFVGLTEPGFLFVPADYDIRIYEFKTMKRVGALHGHIMPVQILYFNRFREHLYSSSHDGTIVWVPRSLCF